MWVVAISVTEDGPLVMVGASDSEDEAAQRVLWRMGLDKAITGYEDPDRVLASALPASIDVTIADVWVHRSTHDAIVWLREQLLWQAITSLNEDTCPDMDRVKAMWSDILQATHVFLAPRTVEGQASGPAGWMVRPDMDPRESTVFDSVVDDIASSYGLAFCDCTSDMTEMS